MPRDIGDCILTHFLMLIKCLGPIIATRMTAVTFQLKHCTYSMNKFYLSNVSCHASSIDKRRCSDLLWLPQMSLLLRKRQSLWHTYSSSHSAKQEGTQQRDTENVSTAVTQNISIAAEAVCSWLERCTCMFLPEWHHLVFKI